MRPLAGGADRIIPMSPGSSTAPAEARAGALSMGPGHPAVSPMAVTPTPSCLPLCRRSVRPRLYPGVPGKTFVVAFGGEVVADDTFPNFIADLNLLASLGIRPVLVHGARPQVEKLLAQRGMESRYHRGIRVTDESQLGSVIGAPARGTGTH